MHTTEQHGITRSRHKTNKRRVNRTFPMKTNTLVNAAWTEEQRPSLFKYGATLGITRKKSTWETSDWAREQKEQNTGDAAKIVVQTASRMKEVTYVEVDSSLAASPSAVWLLMSGRYESIIITCGRGVLYARQTQKHLIEWTHTLWNITPAQTALRR